MSGAPGGSDGQERTEAPTPKRLDDARKEGRVPRTPELSGAVLLLAAAAMLGHAGGDGMARTMREWFVTDTRLLTADPLSLEGAVALLRATGRSFFVALLPFGALALGVTVLVGGIQGRGVISAKPITPKLSNLNPLSAIQRMFSAQTPFVLLKAIAKFAVLGLVTWIVLRHAWPEIISLSAATPDQVLATVRTLAVRLITHVGLAFVVISLADYGFESWRHEKSLRMTKQEVVQEHKESEGDPIIKSRIRSLQRATARKRMLADVKRADVVIVNPTHVAVALKYDPLANAAPIVLAKGERKLAERIKAVAAKAGVPMVENRPLARALLATAKVGRQIPADLYAAVAEVLAYVYRMRGGMPK